MLRTVEKSKGEVMRDPGCEIREPASSPQLGRIGLPGGLKVSFCGSNCAVVGVLSRLKALITRRFQQFLSAFVNFCLLGRFRKNHRDA